MANTKFDDLTAPPQTLALPSKKALVFEFEARDAPGIITRWVVTQEGKNLTVLTLPGPVQSAALQPDNHAVQELQAVRKVTGDSIALYNEQNEQVEGLLSKTSTLT